MSFVKNFGVFLLLAAIAGMALVAPPILYGQNRLERPAPFELRLDRAEIGVSVGEVESGDRAVAPGDAGAAGVVIDDVERDSPADQAGLKRGDMVVSFDGERVRSVRQFTRLVGETPSGQAVDATVVRDGKMVNVRITPHANSRGDLLVDGDGLRLRLNDLNNLQDQLHDQLDARLRTFNLPDFSRPQLGVTVQELPAQLAAYFGATSGVLVAAVSNDSPAARAGLKAGDVITAINGERVESRIELVRVVAKLSARDAANLTISIVRDKKESTVRGRLERADRRL